MNEGNTKQAIVDRIKKSTNILVTVSRNPSVDELSAALGLTLMLNKLDKHATAVFSGEIPAAMEFLEPGKTFENTVDSLRDFIIALDKEKADRLRYKVEDDVVKIFITPYRTTITDKDLNFSQGDFNVELIIALGVEEKDELDAAIVAHGRILHDATIVTINAGSEKSGLGSIDWADANASSLSEMLMSLSEALQSGLVDNSIATALLTGIVAATERFSNTHTSPRVMTMAAQLMAAGANQQLIAARLEEGHAIPSSQPQSPANQEDESDASTKLKEDTSNKIPKSKDKPTPEGEAPAPAASGEMQITHAPAQDVNQDQLDLPEPAKREETPVPPERADAVAEAEQNLAEELDHQTPASSTLSVDDLRKDLAAASAEMTADAEEPKPAADSLVHDSKGGEWQGDNNGAPSMGGTLNATAEDAEADKRREEASSRNHTLLSHDGPNQSSANQSVNGGASEEPPSVDPFAAPMSYEETPAPQTSPPPPRVVEPSTLSAPEEISLPARPTLAELEAQAHAAAGAAPQTSNLDDARAAVDMALGGTVPSSEPVQAGPFSDPFSTTSQPATSLPPPPPLPDFSTLPPLPNQQVETPPHPGVADAPPQFPTPLETPEAPAPDAPADPGQFRIPGQ